MASVLNTTLDLALVIFGFGLLIFVHELGHFLAARWAGIRVLAFAIGFGPAFVSYRKGMGLQRGSSEAAYNELLLQARSKNPDERIAARQRLAGETQAGGPIATTEYRLNVLPLGGYVKMLGQEDGNPAAVSAAPDSYQSCPPIKRMVVISAGVIANIITALVLFIAVFTIGLRTEPAVIGIVDPAGPASNAVLVNASDFENNPPQARLLPGDRVIEVDGEEPRHFNDLGTRVAMSDPARPLSMTIRRKGYDTPIELELAPRVGVTSRLREIGVGPPFTLTLDPQWRDVPEWRERFDTMGLFDIEPGMQLVSLDGTPLETHAEISQIADASSGKPMQAEFLSDEGRRFWVELMPTPDLEVHDANPAADVITPVDHLLGLMPVLGVSDVLDRGFEQGLRSGDIFLRLGETEFPSVLTGVREIKRHAGRTIQAAVLRERERGGYRIEELEMEVTREGTIGFSYSTTGVNDRLFAMPLESLQPMAGGEAFTPAANRLIDSPGTRIVAIEGQSVWSLEDLRRALKQATQDAYEQGEPSAEVAIDVVPWWQPGPLPSTDDTDQQGTAAHDITEVPAELGPATQKVWTLTRSEIESLHELGYTLGPVSSLFEPERFLLKAEHPLGAVGLGMSETRRVAQQTYLTFLRLFQGSVKIEHLRGPVGIAHIGTMIADRGLIWLMFYMALISINLAVVNFLPLPIVDGGQFIMLLYEQFTGRAVPIAVQTGLTLVGLALVAMVFLVVTFNDISNLLGR